MRNTRTPKLKLLTLENRLVPASVAFLNGNLTVTADNTPSTVYITNGAGGTGTEKVYLIPGNQVSYYNANGNLAPYLTPANYKGTGTVTGYTQVTTGSSADFVLIDIPDNQAILGDLRINTGNSADDVIVQSTNTVATVQGRITINGGPGADNLSIVGINAQSSVVVDGGGSGLRPGVVNPFAAGDVFRIFTSTVSSFVQAYNTITALDDTFGGSTIGALYVNNSVANQPGFFIIDGARYPYDPTGVPLADTPTVGFSGMLVIDGLSTVLGNVVYSGSTGTDGVYVYGTVNGQLTASVGAGDNVMYLGDDGTNAGPWSASINSNVAYIGQSGKDNVRIFDGSAVVAGALTLYMGDGANTYYLDNTFSVAGALTLTAGSGNDNVGKVSGSINGNQSYNVGNGDNTFEWNGSGGSARLDYMGGGGVDDVTINNVNAFRLYVYTYAGNDAFRYGLNATVSYAYINLGDGLDTYDDSQTTVTWPYVLVN